MHNTTKIVHEYRGCKILLISSGQSSVHYGIQVGDDLSTIALISVQACKNVIDAHVRNSNRTESYKL